MYIIEDTPTQVWVNTLVPSETPKQMVYGCIPSKYLIIGFD